MVFFFFKDEVNSIQFNFIYKYKSYALNWGKIFSSIANETTTRRNNYAVNKKF